MSANAVPAAGGASPAEPAKQVTSPGSGDDAPLPQLQRSLLDSKTLDQLFFDVSASAENCEIVIKGAPTAHADETRKPTLDEARQLLIARQVLGLQLRYCYQGTEWWDTLLHVPGGIELVRMPRNF